MKQYYEYRHTVCFEETNLVGNVYFVNFFRLQGKARELFIRDHAPGINAEIESGRLALITLHSSCNFLGELKAFDEVSVRMRLEHFMDNRIRMRFDYYKVNTAQPVLVATGLHEAGCYRRTGTGLEPVSIPTHLAEALEAYRPAARQL